LQRRQKALTALIAHPWIWVCLGVPLLLAWSGTIVAIRWNAMEMMIGRNLLAGRGPIVAVLDPPALWRPPLGWLLCAALEVFVRDPFRIFQILYASAVTLLAATAFYVARKVWGLVAAHAACLFILSSTATTSLLIDHVHGLSHIVLLMAIGPAIAATLVALERPTRGWIALAGGSWALAWLARPESAVAFVISGGFILHGSWKAGRMTNALCFAGAFLLVAGPYLLYSHRVRARYGIVGPSALTTFYASEAWIASDGNEDVAFRRATMRYGPIEQHGASLARFLWRHPEVGFERLRTNVPRLLALYTGGSFFHTAWLLALPFAFLDAVWLKRQRRVYLYCLGLFAGSFAVCLFHVDPRYATFGIPPLMLIFGGGTSTFREIARRRGQTWAPATASLGLVVGGAGVGAASLEVLADRLRSGMYGQARQAIRDSEALAADFRARRTASSDVLEIRPAAASAMAREYPTFLASYFAGTALPWFGKEWYPRDSILSMVPKRVDYAYMPESILHRTDILVDHQPLSAVKLSSTETYYLFEGALVPAPLAHLDDDALDALGRILRREYSGLADAFEADRAWARAWVRLREDRSRPVDRVGCGPLALDPDGRPDHVFVIRLFELPPTSKGDFIESIAVQRRWPFGRWTTAGVNFVLGVAPNDHDLLLNRPDGSVRIAVKPDLKIRLLACDDGADTSSSRYRARVQIGARSLVSVPARLEEE
jgi:hypothetical protein